VTEPFPRNTIHALIIALLLTAAPLFPSLARANQADDAAAAALTPADLQPGFVLVTENRAAQDAEQLYTGYLAPATLLAAIERAGASPAEVIVRGFGGLTPEQIRTIMESESMVVVVTLVGDSPATADALRNNAELRPGAMPEPFVVTDVSEQQLPIGDFGFWTTMHASLLEQPIAAHYAVFVNGSHIGAVALMGKAEQVDPTEVERLINLTASRLGIL
jgi:hypothetical protein